MKFSIERVDRWVLLLLLTASVVLNVLLSNELQSHRGLIEKLNANRKLTVGEVVSGIRVRDKNHTEVYLDISSDERPTIVYLNSVNCYWCVRNLPNLKLIAANANAKYRLIIINIESYDPENIFEEFAEHTLFYDPAIETRLELDLTATPATMLLSPKGELTKIWKGAYTTERAVEIGEMLGLPISPVVVEEKEST